MSLSESASPSTADELNEELQTVISDIDSFLSGWLARAPIELRSQSVDPAEKASLEQQIETFREEQRRWETQCESERRLIEDQAEQLSQAWLQLEAEQRQFLQLRGRKQPVARELPAQQEQPRPPEAEETEPSTLPTQPTQPPRAREGGRITNNAVANPRSDTAIQQFQRLRREIDRGRSDWNAF